MRLLTFFLLLAFVLLTSCNSFRQHGPIDEDYNRGTGSLSIEFERNAPPTQMYADQLYDVVLTLQNEGSSDIYNGYVALEFDESVIEPLGATFQSYSLKGRSADVPEGESVVRSFDIATMPLAQESQVRDNVLIVATACFDYATEIPEIVCIDSDPYDMRTENDVCDVRDLSPGGTGGPVGVSSVQVRMSQQEDLITPQFTITIKQMAEGIVFEQGRESYFCTGQLSREDVIGVIGFEATLSDERLLCDKSVVNLIDGEARISCEALPIDIGYTGSYEAPLSIYLDYGYSLSKTLKTRVIR